MYQDQWYIWAIPSFRARPSKSTRRDVSNCEDKQEEARLKTVWGFTHIRGHYPHFPVSTHFPPKDTLSALYSPKDTLSTLCSQNDGQLQGIAGTGARLRCHCQCRVIMSDKQKLLKSQLSLNSYIFLRLRYDGHKVLRAKVPQTNAVLMKIISTLFSGGGWVPSICPTSAQWNWLLRLLDRGQENVSRVFRISRDFQDFVKWNLADVWYKKKFFKDIYKDF